MKRYLLILFLSVLALVPAKAQYYSINIDYKTAAEMAAAFNTEGVTEAYYAEQLSKIREHYQAAEVAAAGIFASKFLDRKALTDVSFWTSSTENYYYRRIYHMVSARIMPKIWTVTIMMLKSPHNAINWGSYIYKVCEETKSLCYQFESIVTNSTLSFKDISFLEINPEFASLFKLSELGDTDWSSMFDSFSNIGSNYSKDNLKFDIDKLYSLGASLASAGSQNNSGELKSNSKFNGTIVEKASNIWNLASGIYSLYERLSSNSDNSLLTQIGGEEGAANLFNLSSYDAEAWLTDYVREEMGQYYTQRWYIYREDKGSISLCDYYPPSGDKDVIEGNHWTRFKTTDQNFYPNSEQTEQILSNSENHAGWSRSRVNQLNNSNDGYTYKISYYRSSYGISKNGKLWAKAYAYEIHVTKSWYNTETIYEDIFDSYSMDLASFQATMNARLAEYNDNEDGYVYYIGSDKKNYYQATNAQKIKGCETATISVTCHDGAKLGQGTTQYKCRKCGSSINNHTKECVMNTSVSESNLDTSEIDGKISEAESHIAMLQNQIDALENENTELVKKISNSNSEDAVTYRQQYNANQDRISALKAEKKDWESQRSELRQAKQETIDGETVPTDDYYRIPAIMQDCKTAYNLTWNGSGSWDGNTFVRTGSMPSINGVITFKATISIARKPKYFLGIKIHRAIIQISWELTTEYSDTQVVDIVNLDPNKSDAEKADQVNKRVSEVAREYPNCEPSVEYAHSSPVEADDTDDTYHLLWASDRLEIARGIDSRLTKIYADLVSLEKMMSYKRSFIDVLLSIGPRINTDNGRKLNIIEQCRKDWLHNATDRSHTDGFNFWQRDE